MVEIDRRSYSPEAIPVRGGSGRLRDKMRLLLWSSTALWRRCVPERVALAVFGFPQRGEFPREQHVWFLLWWYSTGTQSTSGNQFFLIWQS
jgi:hypothetical protein